MFFFRFIFCMDSRDAMLESLYSIFASITGVLLGASVLCMV